MAAIKMIVITGGAGFVGSGLALRFKRDRPSVKIIAIDNLYRRGSELAIARLKNAGIEFMHGDVRCREDLSHIEHFDLMIECSAEPSVKAGYGNDPSYLINTNLLGSINCIEAVRKAKASIVFLSTSRVYSIPKLQALPLAIENKRFIAQIGEPIRGFSEKGVSEAFSVEAPRSLYGATKLASEVVYQEYASMYDLNVIVNRCGVIAGPWQMGKEDQGFIALWLARHLFQGALKYKGFGGKGHQVRDVLHIEDLYSLLTIQLENPLQHRGKTYNVGGGLANSTSLAELSDLCSAVTNTELPIGSDLECHASDIPYYVTDHSEVTERTGWKPQKSLPQLLEETRDWLHSHRSILEPIVGK